VTQSAVPANLRETTPERRAWFLSEILNDDAHCHPVFSTLTRNDDISVQDFLGNQTNED